MVKTSVKKMFFTGDGTYKFFVSLPVTGVDAAITDRFIMLFRDVADETLDKFQSRDGFFHIFVILVAVIMEGNKISIVTVDAGSGDDRSPEIAADIFGNSFRIAFVWLGINIKTIFMLPVAAGLYFFERRANQGFHFVQ